MVNVQHDAGARQHKAHARLAASTWASLVYCARIVRLFYCTPRADARCLRHSPHGSNRLSPAISHCQFADRPFRLSMPGLAPQTAHVPCQEKACAIAYRSCARRYCPTLAYASDENASCIWMDTGNGELTMDNVRYGRLAAL
jgi:hypothetical protein